MASKIFPALLLIGFLAVMLLTFKSSSIIHAPAAAGQANATDSAAQGWKKYWMVVLRPGTHPCQGAADEAATAAQYQSSLDRLQAMGKVLIAGPFDVQQEPCGIFIMNCRDSVEVNRLMHSDTAVLSGKLAYDIRPWWTQAH
ncbi:hypothetical protein KTO58_02610 [Chitinophaga pendula]|uniref:YciI family protein n=1 Tax=Chitinophaga TaxID=79328 RepID=UPI000BAF4904|nr:MULTISPECIES: YciI family protein [Chitinophaga]ASZ14264.1 hypothetical protein CK934_26610 [Chitinophaga sp. MD30]UCJ08091.1 hypothetical protein KTO58_02610 [Chitinophaga pendula]